MSLKVLLRCSDVEFEKLISLMDLESIMDIISELQAEMDREQQKFDDLSARLSHINDQASAEFKDISSQLVKSQNMLALLMTRNLHCFKVSSEPEETNGQLDADESLSIDDRTQSPQEDNSSQSHLPSTLNTVTEENVEPVIGKAKKIVKVVKVTRVTTKKTIKPVELKASQTKATTSPINHTKVSTNGALEETKVKDNRPPETPEPLRRSSTTTLTTVISPRQQPQDVKPRRVLKVRTTSLTGESPANHLTSNANRRLSTGSNSSNVSNKSSKLEVNDEVNHTIETPKFSPRVSSYTSQLSSDSTKSDTSITSQSSNHSRKISTALRAPISDFLPIESFPVTNNSTQNHSTPNTDSMVSPRSDITSLSYAGDVSMSPRSDISNLATPRSFVSSPRMAVSSILELDIPETSIDGGGNNQSWEESPLQTPGGGETDKVSCTTDESGFTSGSSDSDITLAAPDIVYDFLSEEEEKVEERVFMKTWNPVKLLKELYKIELAQEPYNNTHDVINMEGYLERLPVGKNKNTLLKTWKRTYCKAVDGVMYFYARKSSEEALSYMSLMGGVLEEFSTRMIGIDDMRGHYLMVRCPTEVDAMNWKRSFFTQIRCSPTSSYIRPTLTSTPSTHVPKVIIIDLGSTSVRAGILGSTPSYPEVFFPCISSTDKNGQVVFGEDSYQPDIRTNGLHHPVASCKEIDTYRINIQVLPELFKKIFTDLSVDVSEHMILLSTPHNFSHRLKEEVIHILINKYDVAGVNMVNQSLLTPYIYNATSGIVVDIGERIEIVAISDGYLVDGGLNRQSFGGTHITDTLNSYLVEYRLFTPVEQLIARLVKEKTCFVSQDYGDDLLKYMCNESECEAVTDLDEFDLPANCHMRKVSVDTARFKTPEGLMKTELLGVDSPTLPKLIDAAIQKCPMDVRREMWQSIYLSGGTTLTPGFPERLQKELGKIAPSSITIQVHASPHRYHAAYIGACMLAKLPTFAESCISREEWKTNGSACLNKWKRYFQG